MEQPQIDVMVACVSVELVTHVATQEKPANLVLANAELLQLVSAKQPDLTAMLQITYANVPQV